MGALAHRRGGIGAAVAVVGALLIGAPAAAGQMPSTDEPLPGSSFQGADGDQDDAGDAIDWQALQTAGRVRHSPDANADDSAFTGGSHENEPGEWGLTTEAGGVAPAKDNIRDAWSAVDQPGARTFLYLAFARASAQGSTFVTFELNHDNELWDNGRARIPCRRTGDVQISYEAHGGTDVTLVIRRWTTTVADADRGCARRGRFDEMTQVRPNVDAQGVVNDAAITGRLPGAYERTVPAGRFGEAALDLAALLEAGFDEECLGFSSIWMHSRSSESPSSSLQDYVAPRRLDVRTCSASGTKFFDRDADGVRDPGEQGIPRFLIWADYDDDGVRDPVEPFSVSDAEGHYVIFDIRPPSGTYTLREQVVSPRRRARGVADDWICSFPNAATAGGTAEAPGGRFGCGWTSIDAAANPNVTGRDFGNWFPAQLTLEKHLEPADDPGRFDLLLGDDVLLPAAGDGGSVTVRLPPGTYGVSERAATGTDAGAFVSSVECRRDAVDRGRTRNGPAYDGLELLAGDEASCTFRNTRPGVPAIAIRKTGPVLAVAGDTLDYALWVANRGSVSLAEDAVRVTDPRCDRPPVLVSKQGDDSPETLDPGETWRFGCSRRTEAGELCAPTRVGNTAEVSGEAGGTTVGDADSISTILLCPSLPGSPDPQPVDPGGREPGAVAPPGPRPPNAGDSAVAGLVRRATRGCIGARVPRVDFRGTRIAAVRIAVDGRPIRRLTMGVLQRRARPRVRLAPGTYRLTVRVRFQNGSGTPPVTLARTIRICRRPAPPPPCPPAAAAAPASSRCWARRLVQHAGLVAVGAQRLDDRLGVLVPARL